jgi:hypothetical protein
VFREAIGTRTIDPRCLAAVERRALSDLRRRAKNTGFVALAAQNLAIKKIMRQTNKSRGLVRQALHGTQANVFRFASELVNSIRF